VHTTNSRLDEIQAAMLTAKLPHLEAWNEVRRRLAARYIEVLDGLPGIELPPVFDQRVDVFHLFVVTLERRDGASSFLAERGIGTGVHYPLPVHLQPPYEQFGTGAGSLLRSEALAGRVLSLPLFPELSLEDVTYAAEQLKAFLLHGG
jgi:dTDP-4-amino-4,6-dideoxygalactose transaminase